MPVYPGNPVANTQAVAVHYFNGRVISAEDLSAEQAANRALANNLGGAIGPGIVRGYEVRHNTGAGSNASPVVTVSRGVALNAIGHLLWMDQDVQLALTPPVSVEAAEKVFQVCQQSPGGDYVAAGGAYILTVAPASTPRGLANVTGLGNVQSTCNIRFRADSVIFRLIQLPVPSADLSNANLRRNLVAYHCLGPVATPDAVVRPFLPATPNTLDSLRPDKLTDCDVPLCVFYWTATGGIQFVDNWAVRRRVAGSNIDFGAAPIASGPDLAVHEAMSQQFQAQVDDLLRLEPAPASIRAKDRFRYLPPAGIVPMAGSATIGFDPLTFFSSTTRGLTGADPLYIEGSRVQHLFRTAAAFPPIDLQKPEMIWAFWVRENIQAFQSNPAVAPYMVFASGHLPYLGEPRYNLSHWTYSNFI